MGADAAVARAGFAGAGCGEGPLGGGLTTEALAEAVEVAVI